MGPVEEQIVAELLLVNFAEDSVLSDGKINSRSWLKMKDTGANIRPDITGGYDAPGKSETPKFVTTKKMRFMIISFHFCCYIFLLFTV